MTGPPVRESDSPVLRRAWELALEQERQDALHPERAAERRRRTLRWVKRNDIETAGNE